MGKPVRKASGRTFQPMSTLVSDTCRSSPQVESSHSLKTSNQPPSEALKSGLPMAVFATVKLISHIRKVYGLTSEVWCLNFRKNRILLDNSMKTDKILEI